MRVFLRQEKEDTSTFVKEVFQYLMKIDGNCSVYILGKEDYETIERELERVDRIRAKSENYVQAHRGDKGHV